MHVIDWLIVVAYIVWMVADGVRRSKDTDKVEGYFLANRSLPWWAVGLSVMATQLSAITLVGTTGQAYATGLRFIQFYFGLPLAMVILSLTVVPFFHRAKVYTAYEYLERRFDVRTRSLASFLFLLGRTFSLGVVLAAPAVVISAILGWSIPVTVLVIACRRCSTRASAACRRSPGPTSSRCSSSSAACARRSPSCSGHSPGCLLREALRAGGRDRPPSSARLPLRPERDVHVLVGPDWRTVSDAVVLRLRPEPGAAVSHGEVRSTRRDSSLLMSAYCEDPAAVADPQHGRAGVRVLRLQPAAHAVQPAHEARVAAGPYAAEYDALEQEFDSGQLASAARLARAGNERRLPCRATPAFARSGRGRLIVVRQATGDAQYTDVNYVFPTFVTTQMPVGLVGLMIAAIFAAAMSAASRRAQLAVDGDGHRLLSAPLRDRGDRRALSEGLEARDLFWGLFACVVAMYAANQGSLIEVVNRFGSFFYGSLLGVFILAILTTRATAAGAFWGLLAGMGVVVLVAFNTSIAFLWHNLIGAVVVVVVGMAISTFDRTPRSDPR